MPKAYRQGDVILIRRRMRRLSVGKQSSVVLAEGEVTGHKHIARNATLHELEESRFLLTTRETVIEHEEHGPIRPEPGLYEIRIQKEYEPEGWRDVAD